MNNDETKIHGQMNRTFTSVTEMVKALADDDPLVEELKDDLDKKGIVHHLFGLRSSQGVSQATMAERLSCSQSKISKFENGEDGEISLQELTDYLAALDRGVMLFFYRRSQKTMEQIKFHALMIKQCLNHMVELAENDESIGDGVYRSHLETLVNIAKIITDSATSLPNCQIKIPQFVESDDAELVAQNMTSDNAAALT